MKLFRRQKRDWQPTGATRLVWEQGGTVSLDGEQASEDKRRWRPARWLPLTEYRRLIEGHLADHYKSRR